MRSALMMVMMVMMVMMRTDGSSAGSDPTTDVRSRTCSFAGVFIVQGTDRYTLTFDDAVRLCARLSTTLATEEQVNMSFSAGLETCRYGWINSSDLMILRKTSNSNCAGGRTGAIKFLPEGKKYDAYCFNAKDTAQKNCTAEVKPISPPVTGGTTSGKHLHQTPSNKAPVLQLNSTTEENENSTPNMLKATPASEASVPTGWTEISEKVNQTTSMMNELDGDEFLYSTTPVSSLVPNEEEPDSDASGLGSTETQTLNTVFTTADPVHLQTPKDRSEGVKRSSDWLVILLTVLAVLLILLLCFVVAKRKRFCSQRRTLVINKKSRAEGNGPPAPREHERVELMNTEKITRTSEAETAIIISEEKTQTA